MFFQRSGMSNTTRELQISYYENYVANEELRQRVNLAIQQDNLRYQNLIEKSANCMIADPAKLKNILITAVSEYLDAIKDKYFRNEGRKRANELLKKLDGADNPKELIDALASVIDSNKGNENKDSLKTFLFKNINQSFCENKILYYSGYRRPLMHIINKIRKLLQNTEIELRTMEFK